MRPPDRPWRGCGRSRTAGPRRRTALAGGGSQAIPWEAPAHVPWSVQRPASPSGDGTRCDGSAAAQTGVSAADVGHLDPRAIACLGAAQLRLAVAAVAPDPAQQRRQLLVARAPAERAPQVAAVGGEQALVELARGL